MFAETKHNMSNTNTQHVLTAAMVAAYCNAQVRDKRNGNIYSVHALYIETNKFIGSNFEYPFCLSDFQLVLTSPSNITDAQALDVAKEYYSIVPEMHTIENGKKMCSYFQGSKKWHAVSCIEFTDICRSLNIDMGYKNIPSLIAVGLAVEKTN